jgi:hypothetical protein
MSKLLKLALLGVVLGVGCVAVLQSVSPALADKIGGQTTLEEDDCVKL